MKMVKIRLIMASGKSLFVREKVKGGNVIADCVLNTIAAKYGAITAIPTK